MAISLSDFSKNYYSSGANKTIEFDDAMQKYLDEGGKIEFTFQGVDIDLIKQGNRYVSVYNNNPALTYDIQLNNDITVNGFIELDFIPGISEHDRLYIGQKFGSSAVSAVVYFAGLDVTNAALADVQHKENQTKLYERINAQKDANVYVHDPRAGITDFLKQYGVDISNSNWMDAIIKQNQPTQPGGPVSQGTHDLLKQYGVDISNPNWMDDLIKKDI